MRKIEQQMLNAINSKMDWCLDNTRVVYISPTLTNPFGARSDIYLHGNRVAEYWHDSATPLKVNTDTLRRWSTPTTKSRLRALGANVTTRKGVTYLNDVAI
jgi:hypothetical protein